MFDKKSIFYFLSWLTLERKNVNCFLSVFLFAFYSLLFFSLSSLHDTSRENVGCNCISFFLQLIVLYCCYYMSNMITWLLYILLLNIIIIINLNRRTIIKSILPIFQLIIWQNKNFLLKVLFWFSVVWDILTSISILMISLFLKFNKS